MHISFSPLARALLVVLLAGAALPAAAQATADIVITGRVNPGTCTITIPPTTLDEVDANDLIAEDNASKDLALQFTGCVGVRRAMVSFTGTPETGDTNRWANTSPGADAATGVAISLREGATGNQYLYQGLAARPVTIGGAAASYPMRAAYHRRTTTPPALAAGLVSATITVNVAYE